MTAPGSRPSLRRLAIFDATVRCRSIGAAADFIGLSQPAVSHALAKLEQEAGDRLLERGPGGSVPTSAGAILHRRVARMMRRFGAGILSLVPGLGEARVAVIGRNLTDAQVRGHLAIVAAGSFRAASIRLSIAEPTLHRAARSLEAAIAVPLYRRRPSGIAATRAGTRFAGDLGLGLREIEQAFDELAAERGLAEGRLSIGCLPLMPKTLLARVVGEVLRAYPGMVLSLEENSRALLMERLIIGEIDMILGALQRDRVPDGLSERVLFPDPYVVVVAPAHPLARSTRLDVAELANFPWVIPWRDTPRRDVLEALFARLPRRPQVVMETSSLSMMSAILAESRCVTLLARSQAGAEAADHPVLALPVALDWADRSVGITTRTDWLPTPMQKSFLGFLSQMFVG